MYVKSKQIQAYMDMRYIYIYISIYLSLPVSLSLLIPSLISIPNQAALCPPLNLNQYLYIRCSYSQPTKWATLSLTALPIPLETTPQNPHLCTILINMLVNQTSAASSRFLLWLATVPVSRTITLTASWVFSGGSLKSKSPLLCSYVPSLSSPAPERQLHSQWPRISRCCQSGFHCPQLFWASLRSRQKLLSHIQDRRAITGHMLSIRVPGNTQLCACIWIRLRTRIHGVL